MVFEYGTRNGSLFCASKACRIVSVEDNPNWFKEIGEKKRTNQEVILAESVDDYLRAIRTIGEAPDVVVVDADIGFGPDGTHTKSANAPTASLLREEIKFPLRHPRFVERHVEADRYTHINHFGVHPNVTGPKAKTAAFVRHIARRIPMTTAIITQVRQWRAAWIDNGR